MGSNVGVKIAVVVLVENRLKGFFHVLKITCNTKTEGRRPRERPRKTWELQEARNGSNEGEIVQDRRNGQSSKDRNFQPIKW